MGDGHDQRTLAAWWESRQAADMVQWTRISGELTEFVSDLADRPDLIVAIEPGVGRGAPAVYLKDEASIEIDSSICAEGEDPADIHLGTEAGRLRSARLVGASCHEGAHGDAVFGSRWELDQSPQKRAAVQAALWIEESRIEKFHLLKHPGRRLHLRAAYHELVARHTDMRTVAAAAKVAALTGGRVDAGVLDPAEARPVVDAASTVLGPGVYDQLRAVWVEAQTIVAPSRERMEALGQRYLDIVVAAGGDPDEVAGRGDTAVLVCNHPGDGDPDPGGDGDPILGQVAAAVSDAAQREARDQSAVVADHDAAAGRAKDDAGRAADAEVAADVFREITIVSHGHGRGAEGLAGERLPTDGEVAQAAVLAAQVRRAMFREYSRATVHQAAPPGRLDPSKALRRSAEISIGLPPRTKQWRRVRRAYVERPPITVGVGCDISGSMSLVTRSVASAAWVVSHAVHRNHGRFAAVAYGDGVHPIVLPREVPRLVRDFNASGGRENWTGAMRALNGALNLDRADGVRLLVLISDGQYTAQQRADGDIMVARLMRSGVKVLWIGFNGRGGSNGWGGSNGRGGDIVPVGAEYARLSDMSELGSVVGAAMVRLLERA